MKNLEYVRGGKKGAVTRRRKEEAKHRDFEGRWRKVHSNEKWSVTMAKVAIRRAVSKAAWPHWQLLTFTGPHGGESRGVVDMIAIRKDHGKPYPGTNRGDTFQIILIQIKAGQAAWPTEDDLKRIRRVAKRHDAGGIMLARWHRGKATEFYSLPIGAKDWQEVDNLGKFFK
jgi:hypothetical protein